MVLKCIFSYRGLPIAETDHVKLRPLVLRKSGRTADGKDISDMDGDCGRKRTASGLRDAMIPIFEGLPNRHSHLSQRRLLPPLSERRDTCSPFRIQHRGHSVPSTPIGLYEINLSAALAQFSASLLQPSSLWLEAPCSKRLSSLIISASK